MQNYICNTYCCNEFKGDGNNNTIKVVNLENVLKLEGAIIRNFRNYAKELENQLQLINGAIDEYSERIDEAKKNLDLYSTNPIFTFSLISHMRNDWPAWQEYMMQSVGIKQIEVHQRLVTFLPDLSTYKQAARSLHSLFRFYNHDPTSFLTGKTFGHLRFTPRDCYYMGVELFEQQKYHEAIEWLNVAAENSTTSPENDIIGVPHWRVYEMQFKVFNQLNMMDKALTAINAALDMNPENENLQSQLEELNTGDPILAPGKFVSNVEQLCRGNYERDSELICNLNTEVGPFLRLAPLRVEELLYEPYVLLYKDSIYDSEIQHIKAAFERCPPSASLETIEGVKGCAIPDKYSKRTLVLTERVADMAGLDKHYKNWFLFEYGPRDPFSLPDLHKLKGIHYDDVEATAIVFLDDMELGGGITIPNYEMAAFPQRGDALIVFNEAEFPITMCPNMVGKRLIAVKFMFDDK